MKSLKKAGILNFIAVCCLGVGILAVTFATLYNPITADSPPFDWKGLSFASANKYETVVFSEQVTFGDTLPEWADESASAIYRMGIIPDNMLGRIIDGNNNDSALNGVTVYDFTELIGAVCEYFARTPTDYSSMADYLRSQLAANYITLAQERHEITRTEAAQIILSALKITGEDWGSISQEEISGSKMPDDVTLKTIGKIHENEIMVGYGDSYFGNSLKDKFTLDQAVTVAYNFYRYKVRQSGGYYAQ